MSVKGRTPLSLWGLGLLLGLALVASLGTTPTQAEGPAPRRFARPTKVQPGSETRPEPSAAAADDMVSSDGQELKWVSPRKRRVQARSVSTSTRGAKSQPGVDRWARKEEPASPFDDPFEDQTESRARKFVVRVEGEPTLESIEAAAREEADQSASEEYTDPIESGEQEQPAPDGMGKPPELESELAQAPEAKLPPCPRPQDLRPIREITSDITADGVRFPPECSLGDEEFVPRAWQPTNYTWKASGLCHKPLYFEEVALERYGHTWGPIVQPLISGAHFFGTVPLLPYKMGVEPPTECVYSLGYYRPGNCAPHMFRPVPLSLRGAIYEGAAINGLIFLFP